MYAADPRVAVTADAPLRRRLRHPDDLPRTELSVRDAVWKRWVELRWGHLRPGYCQQHVGAPVTFMAGRHAWWCATGHTFTLTSGTPLHRTRVPLSTWEQSVRLLVESDRPLSARSLARVLRSRYATAWRIRSVLMDAIELFNRACRLHGAVEVAEAYVEVSPLDHAELRNPGTFQIAVERRSGTPGLMAIGTCQPSGKVGDFPMQYLGPGAVFVTESTRQWSSWSPPPRPHRVATADLPEDMRRLVGLARECAARAVRWIEAFPQPLRLRQVEQLSQEFTFRHNAKVLANDRETALIGALLTPKPKSRSRRAR